MDYRRLPTSNLYVLTAIPDSYGVDKVPRYIYPTSPFFSSIGTGRGVAPSRFGRVDVWHVAR